MEAVDQIVTWVHVVAGIIALFMAPAAMLTRKGGRAHRRWGKIYFWSMLIIFVTAVILLVLLRWNLFLMTISVVSFYQAWSGYRVLSHKQPGQVKPLDWIVAVGSGLFGVLLVINAALILLNVLPENLMPPAEVRVLTGGLSLLFGAITAQVAWKDIQIFRQHPIEKQWWWYHHMSNMGGSYIAAVTAFLVQNGTRFLPAEISWILWILPMIIGVPSFLYWERRYRQQFNTQAKIRAHEHRGQRI
jgi:uncharacterized membrane protein